jgi:hypothetical protein
LTLTGALDGTYGLLTDDAGLKTILGGGLNTVGSNFFDLSGSTFTAAVLNGMFINGGGSTTTFITGELNTVVLDHSVIDGTTPINTLNNVAIIGDNGGPAGQVTFSNFIGPPGAPAPEPDELKYFGPLGSGSTSGEIINKAPSFFTVDLGAETFSNVPWTINADFPLPALTTSSLNLIFGSTSAPANDLDSQWNINNWNVINITAQGGGNEVLGGAYRNRDFRHSGL